jgi:hypothetical protein
VVNLSLANYSSVGTAMGYGLNGWGSILDRGKRFFSIPQRPDWLWGAPSLLSNWHRGPFPGGKAAETDHSPVSSAEVKSDAEYHLLGYDAVLPPVCSLLC